MSGLRDLMTGSDVCAPSGSLGAGPSNAMSSLVNTLLGTATKSQEQMRDLPHMQHGPMGMIKGQMPPHLMTDAAMGYANTFHALPGQGSSSQSAGLLRGIMGHPADENSHEWDQIYQSSLLPHAYGPSSLPAADHHAATTHPNQQAVSSMLQAFVGSTRAQPVTLSAPTLDASITANLSLVDKCRIRDRSTILSRQMHNADLGPLFADEQVSHLLSSLHIDPRSLPGELSHVHDSSWHGVWGESRSVNQMRPAGAEMAMDAAHAEAVHLRRMEEAWIQQQQQQQQQHQQNRRPSTGWAQEFAAQTPMLSQQQNQGLGSGLGGQPNPSWAQEFSALNLSQQQPAEGKWVEEFATQQESDTGQRGMTTNAMQSMREMVDQLSRDPDPKMRSCQFLQFISKLSHGEISFEGNRVVEGNAEAAAENGSQWANEFSSSAENQVLGERGGEFLHSWQQQQGLRGNWADEFARGFVNVEGGLMGPEAELEAAWKQSQGFRSGLTGDPSSWADELKMEDGVYNEWEKIYGMGQMDASIMGDTVHAPSARRTAGEYVFASENPFAGDADALEKGKDLFRRGVLTEAALAVEAEVARSPVNADAWRLLGTIHAENDDDSQAIAAMERALQADPNHLDVLLSLGVSHTNELDTYQAVGYLNRWLRMHPKYAEVARGMGEAPDDSQLLSHAVRTFETACSSHPDSDELNVALGVLHHLGRRFGPAIEAFERALSLRPGDYSLWNKLGATLANNSRSGEAIGAYQKALDVKPNYMRAWTNMGISFSNLGEYDRSARFYVRALALNPSASQVWGYLRTSLACGGRFDLIKAVDEGDLGLLTQALPLK